MVKLTFSVEDLKTGEVRTVIEKGSTILDGFKKVMRKYDGDVMRPNLRMQLNGKFVDCFDFYFRFKEHYTLIKMENDTEVPQEKMDYYVWDGEYYFAAPFFHKLLMEGTLKPTLISY